MRSIEWTENNAIDYGRKREALFEMLKLKSFEPLLRFCFVWKPDNQYCWSNMGTQMIPMDVGQCAMQYCELGICSDASNVFLQIIFFKQNSISTCENSLVKLVCLVLAVLQNAIIAWKPSPLSLLLQLHVSLHFNTIFIYKRVDDNNNNDVITTYIIYKESFPILLNWLAD